MRFRGFYADANTDEKMVQIIADMIEEGAFDPKIRKLVFEIVRNRGCKHKDFLCEIRAIYDWIKANIRYFYDPTGIDTYHSARSIAFELKGGDCDDFTILAGSMLAAIGYPIKIRIVAKTKNGRFIHVYPVVGVPPQSRNPKQWIPLEFTEPSIPFGEEVPYAKKRDFLVIFEPKNIERYIKRYKDEDK